MPIKEYKAVDAFTVLAAEPRRRILDALRRSARSVNALAEALAISQPTMSKHLKVLREAGFVSCRGEAQQRIYALDRAPFQDVDAWLDPYRRLWARHLDALERHLDRKGGDHEAKRLPGRSGRRGRRRA
jgi:DNA-binding transcriptional ArsR family regulator